MQRRQPSSLHEGGDLVVYRDGEVKHRHDFGKAAGTATFLPHYAVHYADAKHAVEKVTTGCRLALVYSVCLPSTMRHLERNPNKPMSGKLMEIIETMKPGDNSFAMLLSHEYTENSISGYGAGALKGVDRARFRALEEANASVSSEKKLELWIVNLNHHKKRQHTTWNMSKELQVPVSLELFRSVSTLLHDSDDPALAKLFFSALFCHLKEKTKEVPEVVTLLQKFEWCDIGQDLLDALTGNNEESTLGATLAIVSKQPRGDAQQAMLAFTAKLSDKARSSSKKLKEL